MSQSRFERTRFAGCQTAYLTRIQDTALRLVAGDTSTLCPRDGCNSQVRELADGKAFVLFCPECGVIFRGSKSRLLAEAAYNVSVVESAPKPRRDPPADANALEPGPAVAAASLPLVPVT